MSEKVLYACLPFVEFLKEEPIDLGPIRFWPSARSKQYLQEDLPSLLEGYLHTIHKLPQEKKSVACISIDTTIPSERRESLLIDSIYLLYFASNFRNVYYSNEILKLSSFTKILPLSPQILRQETWEKIETAESVCEKTTCINWVDEEIEKALGKALSTVYTPLSDPAHFDESIRLIRAIRFFIDRFFSKFENLTNQGFELSAQLFEPENILFLASSFDVLLNINEQQASSEFRQKIRPMLHLKFSKPVELFWKWVDSFFVLKKQVIQGTPRPDDLFTANPNFQLPLMHIGIKLFVYVLYYKLYQSHLIASEKENPFSPPDFHWIHPEEILHFFWTEESILRKISLLLMQIHNHHKISLENQSDLYLLSSLFVALMEKFYTQTPTKYVKYVPSPESVLEPYLNPILNYGLIDSDKLHPEFLSWLKRRCGLT
ncbi:MAG: hypothetical protein ACSNEK_06810 [Parachlamydiaceae bacterium]